MTNPHQQILSDLKEYISVLEKHNTYAITVLKGFYDDYLEHGKKPFFRKKMSFDKFCKKICFNTKLMIYPPGSVPFEHLRPETYIWFLKHSTIEKLTAKELDIELLTKCIIIELVCMSMYDISKIVSIIKTIERIEKYGESFMIDENIAKLHEYAITKIHTFKKGIWNNATQNPNS